MINPKNICLYVWPNYNSDDSHEKLIEEKIPYSFILRNSSIEGYYAIDIMTENSKFISFRFCIVIANFILDDENKTKFKNVSEFLSLRFPKIKSSLWIHILPSPPICLPSPFSSIILEEIRKYCLSDPDLAKVDNTIRQHMRLKKKKVGILYHLKNDDPNQYHIHFMDINSEDIQFINVIDITIDGEIISVKNDRNSYWNFGPLSKNRGFTLLSKDQIPWAKGK